MRLLRRERIGRAWSVAIAVLLCGAAHPGWGAKSAASSAVVRTVSSTSAQNIDDALRHLASRSAVVFVGQVASIERGPGIVEIRWTVQQAVLGRVGSVYALREWSGLWDAGQQRYQVGERAMVFLHQAGAAGLSSPVDGMEGVVPVVAAHADTAVNSTSSSTMLDVRLLATTVARAAGAPLTAVGQIALQEGVSTAANWAEGNPTRPVRWPSPVRPQPIWHGGPVRPSPESDDVR